MNNAPKIAGYTIAIGFITMIIGFLMMKIFAKPVGWKCLLMLFLIGTILFLVLEFSGAHKKFCKDYCDTPKQ